MSISKSVVISCAGMGKRLGIGSTKCLVTVAGVPLLIRHLQMLDDVEDVRIVVGYQAQEVIDLARSYRSDLTFVFNHDYRTTNTGDSVRLAARFASDLVLTLDGDLLVHPADMHRLLSNDSEFIGLTTPASDDPVLASTNNGVVLGFSRSVGNLEWTGVCQIGSEKLLSGSGHVYQLLEPCLPMSYELIRTKEIDTMNDYDAAVAWVNNNYSD